MKVVHIGDVTAPIKTWQPAIDAPEAELLYIDIAAVDREAKNILNPSRILGSDAPSRARQLLERGDVIVSTVRPNLNTVAHVGVNAHGATASTGFCVLRCQKDRLDSRFLFHWVVGPTFVSEMVRRATGASYPAVSDVIIRDSQIPLPPMEEQRRIAAILDQADALRAKRRAAIAKLDSLTQSIFLDMFGDPVTNPKGITKVRLGDVIIVKSGDFLPTQTFAAGGTFPVYGGNGITGYHDQYLFEEPLIVIGRVGVYCGCVHMTPTKAWVTDNALVVSIKSSKVRVSYLIEAIRNANLNQYAGQAAQPLISASRIYPVSILVPSESSQEQFERRLEGKARLADLIGQGGKDLDTLFASLQHRAFRGEL